MMFDYIIQKLVEDSGQLFPDNGKIAVSTASVLKVQGSSRKNGSVSFLGFINDESSPRLFVRVPRNPGDDSRLQLETDALIELHHLLRNTRLENSVPRVILIDNRDGKKVVWQSVARGRTLIHLIKSSLSMKKQVKRFLPLSLQWLLDFHQISNAGLRVIDDAFVDEHVRQPLGEFKTAVLNDVDFEHVIEGLEKFKNQSIPLTAIHGDFNPHNLMFSEESGITVIDWETYSPKNIPLLDLLHLVIATCIYLPRQPDYPGEGITRFFLKKNWYHHFAANLIQNYCDKMQVNVELAYAYIPVYLAKMALQEIAFNKEDIHEIEVWRNAMRDYFRAGNGLACEV